jgi:hypothetical protein
MSDQTKTNGQTEVTSFDKISIGTDNLTPQEETMKARLQSTCAWLHPMNPYLLVALSLLWLIAFITTVALSPKRPELPLLCGIAAALVIVATFIILRSPKKRLEGRIQHTPDLGAWILYGGFISLFGQLIIRLVASDKFGGSFANFDYGLKCKWANETITGDCQNLAFVSEFETYGHFIQGMFSIFLSPSIHVLLGERWCSMHKSSLLGLIDLLPLGTVLYPTYNLIKRATHSSPYSFAVSSFSNNGAEWAFGFLIGIHLGYVCEALAIHLDLWDHPDLIDTMANRKLFLLSLSFHGEDTNETHKFNNKNCNTHNTENRNKRSTKSHQFLESYHSSLQTLRIIFGIVLFIVSIVTGILYGLTWNTSLTTRTSVDIEKDEVATILLILLPICCWLIVSCFLGKRYQTKKIEKKIYRNSLSLREERKKTREEERKSWVNNELNDISSDQLNRLESGGKN